MAEQPDTINEPEDLLSQALSDVFGDDLKPTPPPSAAPAPAEDEIYTVPIQTYPHFNTTVKTSSESENEENDLEEAQNNGVLAAEACSLGLSPSKEDANEEQVSESEVANKEEPGDESNVVTKSSEQNGESVADTETPNEDPKEQLKRKRSVSAENKPPEESKPHQKKPHIAEPVEEAAECGLSEAEQLKLRKLEEFQRNYVRSQRLAKSRHSTSESSDSLPDTGTLSLMDIGISLNAKGEVKLSMPESIKKQIKSGGSININFDVDCLDEENCLKFRVNEEPPLEKENKKPPTRSDIPQISESESSSERSEDCDSKPKEKDPPKTRDTSSQVDIEQHIEDQYYDEKFMRSSTAKGFISFPRFTQVTGSSLGNVHKVLKTVKKGLSIDKITKKPTWFCSMCNLTGDYGDLGPLFGPFDIFVPPKNSYRNKSMSDGANNLFEKLNSTFKKESVNLDEEQNINVEREEVWLHEDCVCWSPGVYMIGFDVYGLEEIFKVARFTLCSECNEIGANIGCFKENCTKRYHYHCAIKGGCKLITTTFTVLCPSHSHGVVENCLAIKPFMKVRNFLSQEELDESEMLMGTRGFEDAQEQAVKITKTRIIRNRKGGGEKSEKGEGLKERRCRGRPSKKFAIKEQKGGTRNFRCYGCNEVFLKSSRFSSHIKALRHSSCLSDHMRRILGGQNITVPQSYKICFGCGCYVSAGRLPLHYQTNVECKEQVRDVCLEKELDLEEYYCQWDSKAKTIDNNRTYKCYGCNSEVIQISSIRRHFLSDRALQLQCQTKHIQYILHEEDFVPPPDCMICFGCGIYVQKGGILAHCDRGPQSAKFRCREVNIEKYAEKGLDKDELYREALSALIKT